MALRDAIAQVQVQRGDQEPMRGTAFLVAPTLALTAFHMVAERKSNPITFYPGPITLSFPGVTTTAHVCMERWNHLADWVVLECENPPQTNPLPLSRNPNPNEGWSTYGFPNANPEAGMDGTGKVSSLEGTVEGVRAFQLFCDHAAAGQGMPVKGWSGSPVLQNGAVVGFLRWALLNDSKAVAGTLYACPSEMVLNSCVRLIRDSTTSDSSRLLSRRLQWIPWISTIIAVVGAAAFVMRFRDTRILLLIALCGLVSLMNFFVALWRRRRTPPFTAVLLHGAFAAVALFAFIVAIYTQFQSDVADKQEKIDLLQTPVARVPLKQLSDSLHDGTAAGDIALDKYVMFSGIVVSNSACIGLEETRCLGIGESSNSSASLSVEVSKESVGEKSLSGHRIVLVGRIGRNYHGEANKWMIVKPILCRY